MIITRGGPDRSVNATRLSWFGRDPQGGVPSSRASSPVSRPSGQGNRVDRFRLKLDAHRLMDDMAGNALQDPHTFVNDVMQAVDRMAAERFNALGDKALAATEMRRFQGTRQQIQGLAHDTAGDARSVFLLPVSSCFPQNLLAKRRKPWSRPWRTAARCGSSTITWKPAER